MTIKALPATEASGRKEAWKCASRACRHCGVPTASATEEFCCSGCAYVHQLITDAGLGAYYQIKDKITTPADSALLPARDYQWLTAAQREEEAAAGTERSPELRLDVQGISCAGCVWLIERVFNKQEGAGRIDVNAPSGQMRLTWQSGKFDASGFARTLQGFNYLISPASVARSARPESRSMVKRIGLCAAFSMNVMLFTLPTYFGMEATFPYARLFRTLSMAFATLSLLAGGGYFLGKAARSLREGAVNIDLPIALGIVGAYGGSFFGWLLRIDVFVYFDFVSTFILLMLIGRWAQLAAVERNQRRLLAEQPAPPRLKAWNASGIATEISPEQLTQGMRFAVSAGQTIPVEARLTAAEASLSLAWINGESEPRVFREGQRVPSGAVNLAREDLVLVATQDWRQSLLAELTRPAMRAVYRHRFLEHVISGYLVAIIGVAFLSGVGWFVATHDALRTCAVVTAVLVVSCPCAIGLAFPLADEIAVVALRKRGVFVRVADLWPRLSKIRKIVFDKTGTLTFETPELRDSAEFATLSHEARRALFGLVRDNPHPIARCLHERLLASGERDAGDAEARETVGQGATVAFAGAEWRLGRPTWALASHGRTESNAVSVGLPSSDRKLSESAESAAEAVLSRNGQRVASFRFQEAVRADAVSELSRLRGRGLGLVILSGDRREKVEKLAFQLSLPDGAGIGEMTPQDKAVWLQERGSSDALMLGDGANDNLAFDQAFCRGTPVVHRGLLTEKADFYYLGRGISGIRALFEVNDARRRTHAALLVFSILYNLAAVGLAVAGHMNPLLAAILMPVSSLLTLAIVAGGMRSVWR